MNIAELVILRYRQAGDVTPRTIPERGGGRRAISVISPALSGLVAAFMMITEYGVWQRVCTRRLRV